MEPFFIENKASLVSLCQTAICNKSMTKRRERFKSAKNMILCILVLDFVLYVLRMGFFNHKILSGLQTMPPFSLPATVTTNSALDSVCQEHLPARDTWMGGNIMLIAHTPRFIVVKNALASK